MSSEVRKNARVFKSFKHTKSFQTSSPKINTRSSIKISKAPRTNQSSRPYIQSGGYRSKRNAKEQLGLLGTRSLQRRKTISKGKPETPKQDFMGFRSHKKNIKSAKSKFGGSVGSISNFLRPKSRKFSFMQFGNLSDFFISKKFFQLDPEVRALILDLHDYNQKLEKQNFELKKEIRTFLKVNQYLRQTHKIKDKMVENVVENNRLLQKEKLSRKKAIQSYKRFKIFDKRHSKKQSLGGTGAANRSRNRKRIVMEDSMNDISLAFIPDHGKKDDLNISKLSKLAVANESLMVLKDYTKSRTLLGDDQKGGNLKIEGLNNPLMNSPKSSSRSIKPSQRHISPSKKFLGVKPRHTPKNLAQRTPIKGVLTKSPFTKNSPIRKSKTFRKLSMRPRSPERMKLINDNMSLPCLIFKNMGERKFSESRNFSEFGENISESAIYSFASYENENLNYLLNMVNHESQFVNMVSRMVKHAGLKRLQQSLIQLIVRNQKKDKIFLKFEFFVFFKISIFFLKFLCFLVFL